MPIEICSIGGFTKTEGNSVAVKVDDEVVLLDMGLGMEDYIRFTEDREDVSAKSYQALRKANAVPNYNHIKDWKDKVIAIVPSHGHLDHVGAVPFAASLFPKAPVISPPYAIEILRSILRDEKITLKNRLIPLDSNAKYKLSDKVTIEFVHVTHSILHTVIIVVHTPYGKVVYANDFKLDDTPVVGKKPNYERLKQLGQEGDVKLLIVNCLYAHEHKKCPSESVAKQMLKDVMLNVDNKGRAMIVTTFSSHLVRLKSIVEMGKKLNRKIVFIGRSLEKYVQAAEKIDLMKFTNDVQIVRYRDKVVRMLEKIQKEGKDKYLIVCTGHQGEPRAVLSRIAKGQLPFKFDNGDVVVFSCQIIPVEVNKENRAKLEGYLKSKNVRIFKDVHVSGHGALEDHRDLLEMVKPREVMPIHAEPEKAKMLADFAASIGFKKSHVMQDGGRIVLK